MAFLHECNCDAFATLFLQVILVHHLRLVKAAPKYNVRDTEVYESIAMIHSHKLNDCHVYTF